MAYWQTECVEIVRVLINDISDTPTYSDERLERLLVVAGLQVLQEANFSTPYVVDISKGTIVPDPSNDDTKDNAFINLICLKAAVILLDSESRYYSLTSIRISDGPSSIDATSRATFVKEAAKVMNQKYNQMRILHQSGRAGVAIMTPYTVDYLCPQTRFQ